MSAAFRDVSDQDESTKGGTRAIAVTGGGGRAGWLLSVARPLPPRFRDGFGLLLFVARGELVAPAPGCCAKLNLEGHWSVDPEALRRPALSWGRWSSMKRYTSLVGKGVEILFGQAQGEPTLPLSQAKPSSLMGAQPAASPAVETNVEEALAAQWASWQNGEPTSEALGSGLADQAVAVPVSEGPVGTPAPAIPPAHRERSAGVVVRDFARRIDSMAGQESHRQASTLTQSGGRAQVHTRSVAAPAVVPRLEAPATIDLSGETMPSPMYVEAHTNGQGSSAQIPTSDAVPEGPSAGTDTGPTGLSGEVPAALAADGQLEPEGPKTPELLLNEVETHEEEQPSRVRAEEEVINYVAPEQRQALWNEIMELYEIAPNLLCTDENLANALRLLQEAQDILLEKPRQFDVAKYKVGQVSGIVNRRLNTSRWANTYGWAAFAYEVLWTGILILAVFFSPVAVQWIVGISEGIPSMDPVALSVLWNTMAWGGLGGVIGAFYSLYWHAAKKKDFDKQYMMWYIVQPVIGLLVGGLVHLLFGAGFLTVMSKASTTSEVVLSALPYAVACIASFRQRFILEIIDRVIQLLTPPPSEGEQPTKESTSDKPASAALR